ERDVFAAQIDCPKIALGDRLVFFPVGSYVTSVLRTLHDMPSPQEWWYVEGEMRTAEAMHALWSKR
ncbi:MAG: hypothetical protein OWS74_01165, partial [Firmicutes bacterium]|nr:hypothetical protein [Bacillota bacterium]